MICNYIEMIFYMLVSQCNFLIMRKNMTFFKKTVAKVIVKWKEIDKLFSKNENAKRTSLWAKYIDDVFKSLIYDN